MNGNFKIQEVKISGKYGVCAVDTGSSTNLISASFFFQLTIPLSVVPVSDHQLVLRCPFGKTVFSVGRANLKFTLGENEYEGRFEVVADPNLRIIEGFDVVISPARVWKINGGQPQGVRVSPTLFELEMKSLMDCAMWQNRAKRGNEDEKDEEEPAQKLRKL